MPCLARSEVGATVVHFSPHPDDELLGAPATLMALRDAGYQILNVACSLGRAEQRPRREAELRDACRSAGFELMVLDPPVAISDEQDRKSASERLMDHMRSAICKLQPQIIVSPSPHDRHPGHELVARALRDVLRDLAPVRAYWWMWGLWGPLPLPTLGTRFDQLRLEEILTALRAHRGELERNDYRRILRGRAEMYASLGPELLFGFGSEDAEMAEAAYVELLTEVSCDGRWRLGAARWLDPGQALAAPSAVHVEQWLFAESVKPQRGPGGASPTAGVWNEPNGGLT
jgi:LmbE family N-acetylglucosaminyl deacetylase